ncbi:MULTISPECIES: hypothetical protein [Pectobacterium]|uniref:Uncharacterized protein n=1 Tax=Pectobacterium aquaticum TaxID=2204145 RepID=A0AA93AR75_9GAMM|nr:MULTISPECIES: hypothetical protein [Pectobacterium]MBA0169930.1 hypothetical protein [Pectobacterium versatile]RRO07091.1 hypothetical protein DMB85_013965 [Pectobacterium aquaticum]RRO22467.1 hypothetical protein DMB84_006160 [Pectobacterium aquaticum]
MKTNDLSKPGTSGSQHTAARAKQRQSEKGKSDMTSGHKQPVKQSTGDKLPHSTSRHKTLKNLKSEEFILRRNINVFCWNVKATISKEAKRDDLMPVLKRAKENDGTYGRDIADHLLGEEIGREIVGIRLLTICESLNLLENRGGKNRPRYFLTEEGEKALYSRYVMVPEEGTWTIWASDDSLLKYPILYVEPFREGSASDEVRGNKSKDSKARKDRFENIPHWLSNACSITKMPAAIGNEPIRLDHIDTKIERIADNARLSLEWRPEINSLKLNGSIKEISVNSTPKAPEISFSDVWQELLENEQLWHQWQEAKGRLLVSFDLTDNTERSLLQRRLDFVKPGIQKFGNFEQIHRKVALFPQNQEDAQRWAEWKLKDQIHTYATEAEFAKWCQQALMLFEEYSNVIELPTRYELATDAWQNRYDRKNTSTIWHMMAVEDWGI